MNKLVVLVILVAVGWFFRAPLGQAWEDAKDLVPRFRTEMDMKGYQEVLTEYVNRYDGPPGDLKAWMDKEIPERSEDQPSSLDRFGNPYQITRDRERNIYVLRSCGADGECMTEDDVTVDLVEN